MPIFPSRSEINERAARSLYKFIRNELQLSVRAFAEFAGISEPTLRYFLNNNSASAGARRHSQGPRIKTLRPILDLKILPAAVRDALLDALYYVERVLKRYRKDPDE